MKKNPQSKEGHSHLPALDGVRGAAVLMVLLFHFWQGLAAYQHPLSPGLTRLLSVFSIGQKGVDLFFVLSGFLITGILLRTKSAPHYFKNFYIRRSLRIFPLYYATVIGCLIAGAVWSLPQYQWSNNWWYLVYLQNVAVTFWPAAVNGPEHFWSLAVEEHFYLFWPLVVWWLGTRALAWFSLALIVASVVIRVLFLRAGIEVFNFTFCRLDTLALGALLAVCFTSPARWESVKTWTQRLVLPVCGLALASFFLWSGSGGDMLQAFKYTLFAALCGLVLVLALSPGGRNPAPKIFQASWLRGLGKTSYAMYVFHPFIFAQVIGRFYWATWSPVHERFWPALFLELLLAVGLTILASRLSWWLLEHPLIRLKDRFQYENRPTVPVN